MTDVRERIEQQRNALERLVQRIPGFRGYREREGRREADRVVRDWGVQRLETLISHLHDATKQAPLEQMDTWQELVNQVEKLRNELRHSDRGHAGFFDEVKWDDPALLHALHERDAALVERIDATVDAGTGGAPLDELRAEIRQISEALRGREHAILGLQEA